MIYNYLEFCPRNSLKIFIFDPKLAQLRIESGRDPAEYHKSHFFNYFCFIIEYYLNPVELSDSRDSNVQCKVEFLTP